MIASKSKILLAGFGTMGKIYTEKLLKNLQDWNVEIIGLVDTDPDAFDALGPKYEKFLDNEAFQNIPRFTYIDDALAATQPDIVINTTNNEGHIEVIREIAKYPAIKTYITEKPLVGDEADETEAIRRLQDRLVSMNMVTNFSEAAIGLKQWRASRPDLTLVGIDAVWGKDRREDTRPTPGIVNDIVHPIGLVQSVFDAKSWAINGDAVGEHGLLSTDRDGIQNNCVYHYTVGFNTNVAPVRMDSSFGWKQQSRRVTAFLKDDAGKYYGADLFLDEKNPDQPDKRGDYFQVHELDESFKPSKLVAQSAFSTADKVEIFLNRTLQVMRGDLAPEEAALIGLAEEEVIGKLYGDLHPSTDFNVLQGSPHLDIVSKPVDESPAAPIFNRLDQAQPKEIKQRIQALEALQPTMDSTMRNQPRLRM